MLIVQRRRPCQPHTCGEAAWHNPTELGVSGAPWWSPSLLFVRFKGRMLIQAATFLSNNTAEPLTHHPLISLTLPWRLCAGVQNQTQIQMQKYVNAGKLYVNMCLTVKRPQVRIFSNGARQRWRPGDPSADEAPQRHTDWRTTAAAAANSFTPLKTAAGRVAPLNYWNTLLVAPASCITNVFVMHGIAVRNSWAEERENES